MMGRSAPKPNEPDIVRNSTTYDDILITSHSADAMRLIKTRGASELTATIANSMGGSGRINMTMEQARAVRDFLTEMLP